MDGSSSQVSLYRRPAVNAWSSTGTYRARAPSALEALVSSPDILLLFPAPCYYLSATTGAARAIDKVSNIVVA